MCKNVKNNNKLEEEEGLVFDDGVEVAAKTYKRVFKPRLPRKLTSSARINLNAFWNELEEFYDRYDDRRAKNNNNDLIGSVLPAYTTDTFDHAREEAENRINERIESRDLGKSEVSNTKVLLGQKRTRLQSMDILEDSFESEEEDLNSEGDADSRSDSPAGLALWNILEAPEFDPTGSSSNLPSPPPPKSLVDLVSLMARRF